MEEKKKQNLEFTEPVVKVVNIAPQRMICQSEPEPEEAPIRADALTSYDKVYF